MTEAFISNTFVASSYGLEAGKSFEQQFSTVSLESILFDVFAFCAWILEGLFDLHKAETDTIIAELKPHTDSWYRNTAKRFRYGHQLINETDRYDDAGLTAENISTSQIIKYAAVAQSTTESRLILKVATEIQGKLQPISPAQRNAFSAYIAEVKDAGVNISIVNYRPDLLYLSLIIYFDPLVLDKEGNSILDGGRPVEAALETMMKDLPFNGELVLAHLIDRLQLVKGVKIPHLVNAETSWINGLSDTYGATEIINVRRVPESGYFEIVNYNQIIYKSIVDESL